MLFRAPEGFGSLNFQGHEIVADARGLIDITAEAVSERLVHPLVAVLTSHGFVAEPAPYVHPVEKPAEALALAGEVPPPETIPGDTLADADLDEAEDEDDPVEAAPVDSDQFSHMKRGELFAYLKERNVPVNVPINNHDLRALARGTIPKVEAKEAEAKIDAEAAADMPAPPPVP